MNAWRVENDVKMYACPGAVCMTFSALVNSLVAEVERNFAANPHGRASVHNFFLLPRAGLQFYLFISRLVLFFKCKQAW